ncbi:hypothetical protein FOCG_00792 [Fusarium oxysporum f. sp. radicis-lycopersici 26381]|uniref:Uncharacterized protein n=3 Tax=Fusarium oxysporum TaxID=5507 RepID=X0B9X1_FUSOX|nr:hypothetical protein FOZG_05292 [Fusarium oxysporum Fo47]EXA49840.1 hypothetical protein FOVG_02823 [Fusarium oxysporum f. sp. pisi HDV247]EXK41921.1 hypothetical protein FOMG_05120 [Fusarium oxysporum f. sp. melonis 26406]EXL61883.1 hypothetical protein FOCG_00792 [Fusarium oxysporum f. sp. radicis-lycopersici 26381]
MNGRGAVRKSPIDESESNGSMPRLSLMMPIDEMQVGWKDSVMASPCLPTEN